jgi:hypothetical protein
MKEEEYPESIRQLAALVQGTRGGPNVRTSIGAMHRLLHEWNPVGKEVSEVRKMFGEPTEEDSSKLLYRFDNRYQAYEWTMTKADEKVISVSLELRE